jgi:hypothetical protein
MPTLGKKPFMTGHFNLGHSKAALNGVQILYDIRFFATPRLWQQSRQMQIPRVPVDRLRIETPVTGH